VSTDRVAIRWLVSGRVQGVGFRWFVLRRAAELGIVGRAANLADGRVEVVGIGRREDLELLDRAVRTGPKFARVHSVEKCDYPHEVAGIKSFEIS